MRNRREMLRDSRARPVPLSVGDPSEIGSDPVQPAMALGTLVYVVLRQNSAEPIQLSNR
jgi:hypothetical protein